MGTAPMKTFKLVGRSAIKQSRTTTPRSSQADHLGWQAEPSIMQTEQANESREVGIPSNTVAREGAGFPGLAGPWSPLSASMHLSNTLTTESAQAVQLCWLVVLP